MPEVADRMREADDFYFHVSRPGITLPYQENLGVVTSTVQGPVYQALLDALSAGGLRLSELAAVKELAGTTPADLARAVDAGVAMGLFDVAAGPVMSQPADISATVSLASPFNRAILATDALGGRPVALASGTTGTGHSLGDFDAAILHELLEQGSAGLVARVDERLAKSGRSLQKEGKPVADTAERLQLVEQACDAFVKTSLPQLVRLGIVMPA